MSDPKVIYLGPECEDEFCDGRTWADHVAWPDCECKHKPVRYNIGSDYDAALAREAALREELSKLADDYCEKVDDLVDLQQRLTDAEKRVSVMEKALTRIAREHDCGCWPCTGSCVSQTALEITVEAMRDIASDALKPAAEGEGS